MSAHANPLPDQIPDSEELVQIVVTEHDGEWYATEPGTDIVGSSEDALPDGVVPGVELDGQYAALVSYLLKHNDSR